VASGWWLVARWGENEFNAQALLERLVQNGCEFERYKRKCYVTGKLGRRDV